MDFTTLLQNAQSNSGDAIHQLKTLEDNNPVEFINLLSLELANAAKPAPIRKLAGLILKNQFDAKDKEIKEKKQNFWVNLTLEVKNTIKERAFTSLSDPSRDVRSSAAQVLSRIAIIEIPRRESGQLIPIMVTNMRNPNAGLRQGILEALGQICEETDQSSAKDHSDNILTAVVQGMRKDEPEEAVRLAGATALLGALEFAKPNFEREQERNFLMTVICEGTIAESAEIRTMCLQCLVKIATLYYDKLLAWIQNIFNITINAIKLDEGGVALQAIEFWSTICDHETLLMIEAEYYESIGEKIPVEKVCQQFIKKSASFLVAALCESLTKQEDEEQDEDTWNVSSAAGNCLALIALTIKNDIIQFVMPFVQKNIASEDWHYREAAVLAFGSMLEGPKEVPIKDLVKEALSPNILLTKLTDNVVLVRDTAAWTLGRICTFHVGVVTMRITDVIRFFMQSLKDIPRVSSKICWAIHNLAEQYDPLLSSSDDSEITTPLTPFFGELIRDLLIVVGREDADESFLRASAYSTIDILIRNSGTDSRNAVIALVPEFLRRLAATFHNNSEDPETIAELRTFLCGTLRACSMVLGEGQITQGSADGMMHAYLRVWATTKGASVYEEVLMAIGALAGSVRHEFERYMIADFNNLLISSLKNSEDSAVCAVAVGVVTDICRAIGEKMAAFSDPIVTILIEHLKSTTILRDVKPPIMACIGDIALALGSKFERYLPSVMNILVGASGSVLNDRTDLEEVENFNLLRENIFEAYTSIIQALAAGGKEELMLSYVEPILQFVQRVWVDPTKNEAVAKGAVGILGDLGNTLGGKVKNLLVNSPQVNIIITECCKSKNEQTRDIANWAKDIITGL